MTDDDDREDLLASIEWLARTPYERDRGWRIERTELIAEMPARGAATALVVLRDERGCLRSRLHLMTRSGGERWRVAMRLRARDALELRDAIDAMLATLPPHARERRR